MQLVKWNPSRDLFSLNHRIDSLFNDFFYPGDHYNEELSASNWNPVVDIYEDDDTIVIKAELPGVDKKDINIDVKDRVLTLKGERSTDKEVKEDCFYRRERYFGKFERSFTLPTNVDPDKIKADFKNGVLKLDIPKPKEREPKQITIH